MAEYINMQQTEYDEVQASLLTIHEEILKAEKEIREGIWSLIDYEGGLYVQGISFTIMNLLLSMGATAGVLQKNFSASEIATANFIAEVIEADATSI